MIITKYLINYGGSRVKVVIKSFRGYRESVEEALNSIGAGQKLPVSGLIIIKPNLTNSSIPPVTTPVEFIEAIFLYCRKHTEAEIAIGEGTGSGNTMDVFRRLGYKNLAEKYHIRLIDFNAEKPVLLKNNRALVHKEFYLPEIAINSFIISAPVLKDHIFTKTTISMKNMFGLAPPGYYGGSWNKSKLHSPSTHKSVFDICMYKPPSLSVVDASVALSGSHLSGSPLKLGKIIAGFDPVAVDSAGTRMLGHNPEQVEYLVLADGVLGEMVRSEVVL